MLLIDESNAEAYLRAAGRIAPNQPVVIRELTGGVSNVVLLVSRPDGEALFVLKQAREQLRVADPWYCSVERIWREVEVLRVCEDALRQGNTESSAGFDAWPASLPRVLFCDAENYLFAMTAAPLHQVWKRWLLDGHCDPAIAAACGRLLGRLHARTWNQPDVARRLGDQSFFDALRIDPYYRHVARHRPELAGMLHELIDSLASHPRCLVHGDFSPKNLLVADHQLVLVDCEVGHFGDPAFDLGFFLSHLVLKAFYSGRRWWDYLRLTFAFWASYVEELGPVAGDRELGALVRRGIMNFAGCALARVDGKSRVEYLNEPTRGIVRAGAEEVLRQTPTTWSETAALLLLHLGRVNV
jgi:tRNA A-37 threonylcarbamoyl transferase component Bud32